MTRSGRTAPRERAPRNRRGPRPLHALLSLAGLLAAACSAVRTEAVDGFALRYGDTYAWSGGAPPAGGAGSELPWEELRREVEAGLAQRGLRPATTGAPDWLVRARLRVELEVRENDRYFDLYAAEQYEEGTVSVALLDPTSGERVWSGETHERLRYVARTMGGVVSQGWTPTDEERTWHVADAVAKILAQLPSP